MGPDLRHGRPRLLITRATPLILALLLGAAGGAAFAWLRLPLPWMLGAMTTTMAASVAGLRIGVPNSWRTPMLGVMGVLLGSGFTAEVAAGMVRWVPSAATLPVYIVLGLALGLLFLRRFARLDPTTAFFGAAPGGLSEMVVMGERAGGDMRSIALIHATRIFVVVFLIPFALRALAPDGAGSAVPPPTPWPSPLDAVLLLACLLVGMPLGNLLRLPAPFLLGPLLLSAAAHVAGIVTPPPPRVVVAIAQILIGASLGARFSGLDPRTIARTMLLGGGIAVILLVWTFLVAEVLHLGTGLPYLALVLAFAPGGIAEMGLVALALGGDPLFVATHHVLRIGIVVLAAPWLYRLWRRWK